MGSRDRRDSYWKSNIRFVSKLLVVWAIVSLLLSVVLVEPLNHFKIAGFPLGFWFAQQGVIIVFIVLVFIYARRMGQIDDAYEAEERANPSEEDA